MKIQEFHLVYCILATWPRKKWRRSKYTGDSPLVLRSGLRRGPPPCKHTTPNWLSASYTGGGGASLLRRGGGEGGGEDMGIKTQCWEIPCRWHSSCSSPPVSDTGISGELAVTIFLYFLWDHCAQLLTWPGNIKWFCDFDAKERYSRTVFL